MAVGSGQVTSVVTPVASWLIEVGTPEITGPAWSTVVNSKHSDRQQGAARMG